MTIVVGIVDCLDGIVFASDSQNTDGHIKRLDSKKLSVVSFQNMDVLVAEAGRSDLSNRAVQEFQRIAANRSAKDRWDITNAVEEAVRIVHSIMLAGFPGSASTEDVQRYLANNAEFTLLIGLRIKNDARLLRINNVDRVAWPVPGHYHAVGIGREVAEHLLAEYCPKKQPGFESEAVALWVVEKVKQTVSGCDGPTQMVSLSASPLRVFEESEDATPRGKIHDPALIADFENKLKALEEKSKQERASSLEELFYEMKSEIESSSSSEDPDDDDDNEPTQPTN